MTDVTLSCGDMILNAHSLMLSVCSPYFRSVLIQIKFAVFFFWIMDKSGVYKVATNLISFPAIPFFNFFSFFAFPLPSFFLLLLFSNPFPFLPPFPVYPPSAPLLPLPFFPLSFFPTRYSSTTAFLGKGNFIHPWDWREAVSVSVCPSDVTI